MMPAAEGGMAQEQYYYPQYQYDMSVPSSAVSLPQFHQELGFPLDATQHAGPSHAHGLLPPSQATVQDDDCVFSGGHFNYQ